jgi:hypothetical protein
MYTWDEDFGATSTYNALTKQVSTHARWCQSTFIVRDGRVETWRSGGTVCRR